MSAVKEELHAVVESLTEEDAASLLRMARDLRGAGEHVPLQDASECAALPGRWPPRFRDVAQAVAAGRRAGETLFEDLRR